MLFSGLRVQIAVTLAVLLTLGILLGNVVIIAFLQKGAVRTEVEHARSVWQTALSNNGNRLNVNLLKSNDEFGTLKTLCGYTGKRCVGVLLSGGEFWLKNGLSELRTRGLQLAHESALSQKEIIRLDGNPWGVISIRDRYLFVAEPFQSSGSEELKSAVMVLTLDSIYESIFDNKKAIFVYLLVNVIVLTVVGFFRLIKITVRPIERMVRMSESYHDSDVWFFSGEQKRSELDQLSMALNAMLYRIESDREKLRKTVTSLENANSELLKTQKEMIRTEKIASVGRLSAGLAHEIGNPLGIAQGYVELLQQPGLEQAEKQQFAERALSELDRVNRLIRQLLDYAGTSSHETSMINLHRLFEEICQIVTIKKYNPPITLFIDIPPDIFIKCDGESLRQVFLNCLLNALDAIESKEGELEGQLTITVEKIVESENNQAKVYIRIKDNGIGIDQRDLDVIFDPFFTTKDPGKGTGLGLFVSHAIIDAHGGRIWINSTLSKGSTVYIDLPIYPDPDQGERDETSYH
ncbi:MAG: ATP-binding protein [Desulforhopalus sp.]